MGRRAYWKLQVSQFIGRQIRIQNISIIHHILHIIEYWYTMGNLISSSLGRWRIILSDHCNGVGLRNTWMRQGINGKYIKYLSATRKLSNRFRYVLRKYLQIYLLVFWRFFILVFFVWYINEKCTFAMSLCTYNYQNGWSGNLNRS